MTCLAAIVEKGTVWIGADSTNSEPDSGDLTISRDSKVFKRGEILIAHAGDLRLGNLMQYVLEIPRRTDRKRNDMAYLAGPFAAAVKRCMTDNAWETPRDAEDNGGFDFQFLIGYRGAIYLMGEALDLCRSVEDFETAGSGSEIARGVLYATPKMAPRARIIKALTASSKYNAFVRGPYKVLSL